IGLEGNTISLLASGVVGIVLFLATIPAVLYIDIWGRKPTLIAGAAVMGTCHLVVAIIIATCSDNWPAHRAAGWVACSFVWIFAAAFGVSYGPGGWVVIAEIFPLGLRAKGVSIGAASNWLNNFAVAMSTPDFITTAPYGVFIFLGLICFVSIAYVFFFVPETKQKSLDELDAVFGDNSGRSQWEAGMMLQAQRDVGLLRLAGIEESKGPAHGDNVSDHLDEKNSLSDSEPKKEGHVVTSTA
ncbi:hypothetical protein, partial [Sporisorium scitamineum]